jgi:CheY-like chemotaxis protein
LAVLIEESRAATFPTESCGIGARRDRPEVAILGRRLWLIIAKHWLVPSLSRLHLGPKKYGYFDRTVSCTSPDPQNSYNTMTVNLLVVNGQPGILELISDYFTEKNIRVAAAGSLCEGRELAANTPLDFAIVDLDLPDGSGLDLLPVLTKVHPRILVFISTATRSPEDQIKTARVAGAHGIFCKPFAMVNIMSQITTCMVDRAMLEQAAETTRRKALSTN